MTFEELVSLVNQGEGQRLEFKQGVPSIKDLVQVVICLANAGGGTILLGVEDRGQISGCRTYDVPELLTGIYRASEPPITVDVQEVPTPHGTVLAVNVPRTPFVHATAGGVFLRRVGKQCLPMSPADILASQSERSGLDYSALPLGQARFADDVDPEALRLLRREIQLRSPSLGQLSDRDLLRNLRLLVGDEECTCYLYQV